MASAHGTADIRHSFTVPYLSGATLFAWRAREIEDTAGDTISDSTRTEHRAYVTTAIMQSQAALEAEIWEVIHHGPGHHLGSNGVDLVARDFLLPLSDMIEGEKPLDRYQHVLHLLHL